MKLALLILLLVTSPISRCAEDHVATLTPSAVTAESGMMPDASTWQEGQTATTAMILPGPVYWRGFLSYDVSTIPSGAVITSASLNVSAGLLYSGGALIEWRFQVYSGFEVDVDDEATTWAAGSNIGEISYTAATAGEFPTAYAVIDIDGPYLDGLRSGDRIAFKFVWNCVPDDVAGIWYPSVAQSVLTLGYTAKVLDYASSLETATDRRSCVETGRDMGCALITSLEASSGLETGRDNVSTLETIRDASSVLKGV